MDVKDNTDKGTTVPLSPSLTQTTSHQGIQTVSDWVWSLPSHFPPPVIPQDNPMTYAKFELGRYLFFDKRLSGNSTLSCGGCHLQHLAFTDGRALPIGSTGDVVPKSAMSLTNVAYYRTLTWANPSQYSLEIQAVVPMFVDNLAIELGINDENKATVLARFKNDERYQRLFLEAFPEEKESQKDDKHQRINFQNIIRAISTFERGLISSDSRYDQALAGKITLTPAEIRGQKLFYSNKAQCFKCHSGFNFSDQTYSTQAPHLEPIYHNTGLYNVDGQGGYPDESPGLIAVMPKAENMGRFRVPSLRNIAVTAPYMHDGSIKTLEEVLDFYAQHGRNITQGTHKGDGRKNPFKDPILNNIRLTKNERTDIIAFLKTLTDESFLTNPRFADPFSGSLTGH